MSSVSFRSPAKLNLFLEVTGKRADGYHELETVMVRTDICDVMTFSPRTDRRIALSCVNHDNTATSAGLSTAASFPLDDSNLIIRAAKLLQQHCGVHNGATIRIQKSIPAQAGLGGGSGNAATTLRALNQLWKLQLDDGVLHSFASQLGSDINFLLSGYRAAVCFGRGECIEPVPFSGTINGVLVVPATGNSTAEVFSALNGNTGNRRPDELLKSMAAGNLKSLGDRSFNRLQEPACQLNSQIASVLNRLSRLNGSSLLTGSGSGCITLTESHRQAQRIAAFLPHSQDRMVTTFRV